MNNKTFLTGILLPVLKTTLAVVIFTITMLLLFALLTYKFHFSDAIVHTGILLLYFVGNFIGGLIIGKVKEERKFLWGILSGMSYFILLSLLSFLMLHEFYISPSSALTAFFCCIAGGFFGGMFA